MSTADRQRVFRNPLALAALAAVGAAAALALLTPLDAEWSLLAAVAAVALAYLAVDRSAPRRFARKTGVEPWGLLLGGGLYAAGTAAAHALGDPSPFCDGVRRCLTLYGWGTVLFAGGCFGLAIAAGATPRHRRLANATVGPAADVSPGPAAVVGRVRPAGPPIETPATAAEAVWYHLAVEQSGRWGWRPVAERTDGAPFYVVDGSGRVLVDPADVDEYVLAEYGEHAEVVVGADERAPPRIDDFEHEAFGEASEGHEAFEGTAEGTDAATRYRETYLPPETVVFVVGEAVETDRVEYPERIVVGAGGTPVVIAPERQDVVRRAARWRVLAGAGLGLALAGVGALLMLVGTLI